jgi:hypothetical protein
MRMKTLKALRATANWIQRVLDARLPLEALYTPRPTSNKTGMGGERK